MSGQSGGIVAAIKGHPGFLALALVGTIVGGVAAFIGNVKDIWCSVATCEAPARPPDLVTDAELRTAHNSLSKMLNAVATREPGAHPYGRYESVYIELLSDLDTLAVWISAKAGAIDSPATATSYQILASQIGILRRLIADLQRFHREQTHISPVFATEYKSQLDDMFLFMLTLLNKANTS